MVAMVIIKNAMGNIIVYFQIWWRKYIYNSHLFDKIRY